MGTSRSAGTTGRPVLLFLPAFALLAEACISGSGGTASSTSPSTSVTPMTGCGDERAVAGTSPYCEVKTGNVPGLGRSWSMGRV